MCTKTPQDLRTHAGYCNAKHLFGTADEQNGLESHAATGRGAAVQQRASDNGRAVTVDGTRVQLPDDTALFRQAKGLGSAALGGGRSAPDEGESGVAVGRRRGGGLESRESDRRGGPLLFKPGRTAHRGSVIFSGVSGRCDGPQGVS